MSGFGAADTARSPRDAGIAIDSGDRRNEQPTAVAERFNHSGPEAVHSLEPSQVSRRSLCGLQLSVESGLPVFFADPRSPWQRGSNENTNGLLRHYFPKRTDLSRWTAEGLAAIAHTLNTRATKDSRMANSRQSSGRASTVTTNVKCCDDRLNPP